MLFDPGRVAVPRMTVLLMLRSAVETASAPSGKDISGLNHTPYATAVYASRPALPSDSRNTRFQAACYALPGLDFHQLTAPASWRTSTHPLMSPVKPRRRIKPPSPRISSEVIDAMIVQR